MAGEPPVPADGTNQSIRSNSLYPPELTRCDQWVCWRTQTRGEKPTKVPLNPDTGRFASVNDPESWTNFDDATSFATQDSVDGIGFVFTEDDPFVGVDLDDCRDPNTGDVDEWAEDVIDTLDSYTEVSPSGTGIHVIARGRLPGDRRRRDTIELYDESRFFTMTGDHVDRTPTRAEDRNDELETVFRRYLLQEDDEANENDEADGSESDENDKDTRDATLTDDELLEWARSAANGEKFSRLWGGSTSGYESQSEADMALCSILAFWTGRDATRIDRLFRTSGLYREKWDERHFADGSTYGEKTVERAVERVTETFDLDSTSNSGDEDTSSPPAPETTEPTSTDEPDSVSVELISNLERRIAELEAENSSLQTSLSDCKAELETKPEPDPIERADDRSNFLARVRSLLKIS